MHMAFPNFCKLQQTLGKETSILVQSPSSLEVSQARLDGAWSNRIVEGAPAHDRGGQWMGFRAPSNPNLCGILIYTAARNTMWEIPHIQPLDRLATMAPIYLLGRPDCSETFVAQLQCTNFSYNSNKFQTATALLSPGAVPASPLHPSSPALTDVPHHLPQCSILFMYWIGPSFTTCMWPTAEDTWALLSLDCIIPQTLFTCFSKDSGTVQPMFWRVVSTAHVHPKSSVIHLKVPWQWKLSSNSSSS